jgi:hypothetical protein
MPAVFKRLACTAGCLATIAAALFLFTPPTPKDAAITWPVYLAGAICLAAIAIWPAVLKGRPAWIAVMLVAAAGAVAGLAAQRSQICCSFVAGRLRGYPYPWLNRYAEYSDLPGLRIPPTFDRDAHWVVDPLALVADGLYWICAGVVLVVVCAAILKLARRLGSAPSGSLAA